MKSEACDYPKLVNFPKTDRIDGIILSPRPCRRILNLTLETLVSPSLYLNDNFYPSKRSCFKEAESINRIPHQDPGSISCSVVSSDSNVFEFESKPYRELALNALELTEVVKSIETETTKGSKTTELYETKPNYVNPESESESKSKSKTTVSNQDFPKSSMNDLWLSFFGISIPFKNLHKIPGVSEVLDLLRFFDRMALLYKATRILIYVLSSNEKLSIIGILNSFLALIAVTLIFEDVYDISWIKTKDLFNLFYISKFQLRIA
jgi:hypothetical protein